MVKPKQEFIQSNLQAEYDQLREEMQQQSTPPPPTISAVSITSTSTDTSRSSTQVLDPYVIIGQNGNKE